MLQLVAVIILDLPWVLFPSPSFLVSDLNRIDFRGRNISGFPGISLVSMLLLFVIFSSLIGRFGIGGSRCGSGGGTFTSGFIPATHYSLGLDFVHGGVSGSVSSEDLYISLSYIRTRS